MLLGDTPIHNVTKELGPNTGLIAFEPKSDTIDSYDTLGELQ